MGCYTCTSILVLEASTSERPFSPSSYALVRFQKDNENGEQTIMLPNPTLEDETPLWG